MNATSIISGIGAGEDLRNPDNLITVTDQLKELDGEIGDLKVTVNKDGSITLDGKANSDLSLDIFVDLDGFGKTALMTLAGADFGDKAEGTYLAVYNGSVVEAKSESTDVVFISNDNTIHTVKLVIPSDAEFDNVTIYPVLNYGIKSVDFYSVIQ